MTPCPHCGAVRFTTCASHGAWCVPCTKAMNCPGCQRGESTLVLLLTATSIFAGATFCFWAPRLFGSGSLP